MGPDVPIRVVNVQQQLIVFCGLCGTLCVKGSLCLPAGQTEEGCVPPQSCLDSFYTPGVCSSDRKESKGLFLGELRKLEAESSRLGGVSVAL